MEAWLLNSVITSHVHQLKIGEIILTFFPTSKEKRICSSFGSVLLLVDSSNADGHIYEPNISFKTFFLTQP